MEEGRRKRGGGEEEERRKRREERKKERPLERRRSTGEGQIPLAKYMEREVEGGEAGGEPQGNDAAPYADDDDDASSAPEASLRGCDSKTAHRSC